MRSKYDKYYDFSTSLAMGVILIVIGMILLFGKERLYKDIVSIVVLILLLISIFNLFKFLSRNRTVKENSNALMSSIFNLAVSLLFVTIPNLSYGLFPFLFSIYLLIISVSNLVMYFVFFFNKTPRRMKYLFYFLIFLFRCLF